MLLHASPLTLSGFKLTPSPTPSANLLRTLALPEAAHHRPMTTRRDRLVKIRAKIVRHGRPVLFQMNEVKVPCVPFGEISQRIALLRALPMPS